MTRSRIHGEDSPFGGWLRSRPELPSTHLVATDLDFSIQRYKTHVDGEGSRDIQSMMLLEVKTRSGKPKESQLETLWLTHRSAETQSRTNPIKFNGKILKHPGVSILSLSGQTPDDSIEINWGRFTKDRHRPLLHWKKINVSQLIKLLNFEIHPDNFEPNIYRRHHKTMTVTRMEVQPLGFMIEVMETLRS
jgi:hypothetical protein